MLVAPYSGHRKFTNAGALSSDRIGLRIYCDALVGSVFSRTLSRRLSPRESNPICSHSHLPSASRSRAVERQPPREAYRHSLKQAEPEMFRCCRKNGATSPISRSMLKESGWTSGLSLISSKSLNSAPLRCCKASIVASSRHLVD